MPGEIRGFRERGLNLQPPCNKWGNRGTKGSQPVMAEPDSTLSQPLSPIFVSGHICTSCLTLSQTSGRHQSCSSARRRGGLFPLPPGCLSGFSHPTCPKMALESSSPNVGLGQTTCPSPRQPYSLSISLLSVSLTRPLFPSCGCCLDPLLSALPGPCPSLLPTLPAPRATSSNPPPHGSQRRFQNLIIPPLLLKTLPWCQGNLGTSLTS